MTLKAKKTEVISPSTALELGSKTQTVLHFKSKGVMVCTSTTAILTQYAPLFFFSCHRSL